MSWPFLYFPDDRLSRAELSAARLDGDLVEIGEAYMPADAVETRELRAGSLRERISPELAVTRESAAWVHGAIAEPPARHRVQRCSAHRIHQVIDIGLVYRDHALKPGDAEIVSGVAVTTPEKTLGDLVRDLCAGSDTASVIDALLTWRPALAIRAADALDSGPPVHFKRAGVAYLRARAQEEVTRYTS
ncbi:SAM-dependent methyltransferase [Microbacterium sp. VKM Ac-2870]|uniref:SAM-dependent methyltransferase n=1 Tax=Microbacterium sp. VKM Ac-2870 TaxID=2783825 RepID=UPI00188BFC14|nr:SAM-dependent methyltransferase [Microbacterium sp. VKM Ac-2870]MBF4560920.1 SAM-dependent methyltransferase [Microbacterium sp. VKM Ac-2870]